jgi:hypothetical protein
MSFTRQHSQPIVAYKWEGTHSSIVPPKFGWFDAFPEDNEYPDVPRTFRISYRYETKCGYY